jgi:uncharacterized oxidoreductase
MLFDSAHFAGREHFRTEVTTLAANVRSCPPAADSPGVQLPGDPERRARAQRETAGVRLDDGTWGQLTALAEPLGVAVPA